MAKKKLDKWVVNNRVAIDECIRRIRPEMCINDEDRKFWVINDEFINEMARAHNVKVTGIIVFP